MDVKKMFVLDHNSRIFPFLKEFNYFSSLDDYRNAFEKFKNENGHYPSAIEIDATPYFPNCKTITRKFGGLVKLRSLLNLPNGDIDHRTGERRILVATNKNLLAFNNELELYKLLVQKYGECNVHRQSPYVPDKMLRSDFKLFFPDGQSIFIDTFYPENKRSLSGCVSIKQNKLKNIDAKQQIYFAVMNKDMSQEFIDMYVSMKKNKLPENIKVISYNTLMNMLFVV